MPHYHEVVDDLRVPTRELRRAIPETWAAFTELHAKAMEDGVLPRKIKELIALGAAVAAACDGCIAFHARGAAKAGATREEVAEALGVMLLMVGGPASVYAPRAFAAFDEYREEP